MPSLRQSKTNQRLTPSVIQDQAIRRKYARIVTPVEADVVSRVVTALESGISRLVSVKNSIPNIVASHASNTTQRSTGDTYKVNSSVGYTEEVHTAKLFKFGPLEVDSTAQKVFYGDIDLGFSQQEAVVFIYGARRPGCPIRQTEFIVYALRRKISERIKRPVEDIIYFIRQVLEAHELDWMIKTAKGSGYVFREKPTQ